MSHVHESQLALEKAADSLSDADFNLADGRVTAAVNRAYYGMYYCLCALFFSENTHTKTHKGAQQRFYDLFIRTERFPIVAAKWISDAYNLRQLGDYDFESTISDDTAIQLLQHAHQFYELTDHYLTNGKGQS